MCLNIFNPPIVLSWSGDLNVSAKSKIVKATDKIAEKVVGSYKKRNCGCRRLH